MPGLVQWRYTIPITCGVDGLAHEVTDENAAAGRSTGKYLAECGHRILAAATAQNSQLRKTPAGRRSSVPHSLQLPAVSRFHPRRHSAPNGSRGAAPR